MVFVGYMNLLIFLKFLNVVILYILKDFKNSWISKFFMLMFLEFMWKGWSLI